MGFCRELRSMRKKMLGCKFEPKQDNLMRNGCVYTFQEFSPGILESECSIMAQSGESGIPQLESHLWHEATVV